MTRSGRTLVVLVALALVTLAWEGTPSADAAMNVYTGVVTHVRDGDTIVVDIGEPGEGDDRQAAWDPVYLGTAVRIYGANTFADEVGHIECWGPAATRFLTDEPGGEFAYAMALEGRQVELRGFLNDDLDQFGRVTMRAFVDGVDLAKTILKAGLGLPMPSNELTDQQNDGYRQKAANARIAERRIWNDRKCGVGPYQSAVLTLRVRFDADGDDNLNLGSEWVEVINNGTIAVNLLNWELRDSQMYNHHRFTSTFWLQPNMRVRVIGGESALPADTSTTKMMRWEDAAPGDQLNTEEMFLNRGDVVVLLDPTNGTCPADGCGGDIRAFTEFPCTTAYQVCTDPLSGSVALWAHYNPPGSGTAASPNDKNWNEWIDVWNLGTASIDLYNYYLRNDVDTYLFDTSTVIEPGAYMRVRIGILPTGSNAIKPTDTNVRFWGKPTLTASGQPNLRLADPGDRVELIGIDGREAACYGWGTESCKKSAVSPALEVVVIYDGSYWGNASETSENTIPNREWVRVRNTGDASVNINQYVLELPVIDPAPSGYSAGNSMIYDMPDVTLDPGDVLTFHMGAAPANPSAGHYYLGFPTSPLFKSGATVNVWKLEEGITPRIRLAGTTTWPCAGSGCTPTGLIVSDVWPGANNSDMSEYIDITNPTGNPVSLADWWIKTNYEIHYYFPDGATIPAGGTVRVHTAVGTDDADDFYWDRPYSNPADDDSGHAIGTNGWVELYSPKSFKVDCERTGIGTCP